MKKNFTEYLLTALALFCLFCHTPARAQTVESATAGRSSLSVGATGSGAYFQYGGVKELGLTAFVDADGSRRIGLEGEGRWIEYHKVEDVHVEQYLGGLRYHMTWHRFRPYAKGLAGIGYFNFPFNYAHGSYLVVAGGGGVDYRLKGRLSWRAIDYEYQYWPQFTFGAMSSDIVSTGIRYRIF